MMPQNLDALFSKLTDASSGSHPVAVGTPSDAAAWGEALAMFERFGQEAIANGEDDVLHGQWVKKLAEISAQADNEDALSGDLATEELDRLFGLLNTNGSQSELKPLNAVQAPLETQPHYSADYWPSSGELMLLRQGISPWGEDLSQDQQKWLDQVGPYIEIPALTAFYGGDVEVNRDFTLVNLADAAGGDPQSAFRDGWLGTAKPDIARTVYELSWAVREQAALTAQANSSEALFGEGHSDQKLDEPALSLSDEALNQLVEVLAFQTRKASNINADQGSDLSRLAEIQATLGEGEGRQDRSATEINRLLAQLKQILLGAGPDAPSLQQSGVQLDRLPSQVASSDLSRREQALSRLAEIQAALGQGEGRQDRSATEINRLLAQLKQVLLGAGPDAPSLQQSGVQLDRLPSQVASSDLSRREQALSRLAEIQAALGQGEGRQDRSVAEINRAVLLSQQFQSAANSTQILAPEQRPSLARTEPHHQSVSLLAASTAPAREPALPPTAQLMGQPGATAGEMRAAAEQAMQRVVWMASREQGVSQARLQLHPAHLGKVDVQLEVTGREVSVVLNVQNGPVREAMEAMLPRLRDQLEQQGINLGDASVFDSESEDSSPENRSGTDGVLSALGSDGEGESEELLVQTELNLRGRGLLDAYA